MQAAKPEPVGAQIEMNGDGTGIKISGSDSGTMQSLATKMQERTQGMVAAKGCP